MTDKEAVILTLVGELDDAIRVRDWPRALPVWEFLERLHPHIADWHPSVAIILRNEAAMVQLAGQQTTKVH